MLIDLLNSYNYITINLDAIKLLGLNGAVYCAELLNIYKKAIIKKKLMNSMVIVDRKYIAERTTLTEEDQYALDLNLIKIKIIEKDPANPDLISFDIERYASLLASEDMEVIKTVKTKMNVQTPRGVRESKRQAIKNNLLKSIVCSNEELLAALRDWADTVYTNSTLTEKQIKIFQETLNNYTKGDLDLALKIVSIATANSYKDCNFAINVYERSLNPNVTTNTVFNEINNKPQKKAKSTSLSDIVF